MSLEYVVHEVEEVVQDIDLTVEARLKSHDKLLIFVNFIFFFICALLLIIHLVPFHQHLLPVLSQLRLSDSLFNGFD